MKNVKKDIIRPDFTCNEHRKYKGTKKPRTLCSPCWLIYLDYIGWIHPDTFHYVKDSVISLKVSGGI